MRNIVKPTKKSRKEILKTFRYGPKNTVFVNMFTGKITGKTYYRPDKGEYLSNVEKDSYEFHVNKRNPFYAYDIVDDQIDYQYQSAKTYVEDEITFLKDEINRDILPYEVEIEFNKNIKIMSERLEFLSGIKTKIYKTEFGDEYLKPDDEQIKELMLDQTRGCYQYSAILRLYNQGYIIGYLADGSKIKGKAGKYLGRYQTSLRNVIERINKVLPEEIKICSGAIGPKGAFGYYLEVY